MTSISILYRDRTRKSNWGAEKIIEKAEYIFFYFHFNEMKIRNTKKMKAKSNRRMLPEIIEFWEHYMAKKGTSERKR